MTQARIRRLKRRQERIIGPRRKIQVRIRRPRRSKKESTGMERTKTEYRERREVNKKPSEPWRKERMERLTHATSGLCSWMKD